MTRRPAATARVRDEWSRRIEAEYRSAALTQELAHMLVVLGAPEWLVRDAMRITTDELTHARLSHSVAAAAGASTMPVIDRASLTHLRAPGETLEAVVTCLVVEQYCLGETLAVRLFSAMRRECDVAVARRALDRILRDEVRHRDFGFDALAWLFELPDGFALRAAADTFLPGALARQRAAYAPAGLALERSLPEVERRWGLLPGASYVRLTDAAPRRDYAPRFARIGVSVPG